MSEYHGDIRLGDTIDIQFNTALNGTLTTLAGSPVVSAYIGNSDVQITAGITLAVDHDSRTGYNNVRVVATSGNGYATATNVSLVVTTGTVGGNSVVGNIIGSFSIEARSALMPTVAARPLDVTATGAAGIDWANVENQSTAVSLSSTGIATAAAVAAVTTVTNLTNAPTSGDFTATMKTSIGTAVAASAVASVTGNVGGNVTGSVGSVVGAVGSVTGAVGSVTGAVGSVTGAVGSVTAPVTVGTNSDKTGYRLSATGVADIVSGGAITTLGGLVSADVKQINATTVLGTGAAGDLWRG